MFSEGLEGVFTKNFSGGFTPRSSHLFVNRSEFGSRSTPDLVNTNIAACSANIFIKNCKAGQSLTVSWGLLEFEDIFTSRGGGVSCAFTNSSESV